jgi:hypothetical protein
MFPPIAAVRLVRRRLRAASAEKTDFDVGPAVLNRGLAALFASEARLVSRLRLPFGVSLLALARRG